MVARGAPQIQCMVDPRASEHAILDTLELPELTNVMHLDFGLLFQSHCRVSQVHVYFLQISEMV